MTPAQIDLVQASFAKVAPQADAAGAAFYARLFETAPELRPLFPAEMSGQAAKLMKTLAFVVGGLKDLSGVLPAAQDLAARHVAYGVTPAMYAPVGAALIDTLDAALGEAFDAETRDAWAAAYGLLSEAMVASAYAAAPKETA